MDRLTRDLPILEAAIRHLDANPGQVGARFDAIASTTGLDLGDVVVSARYLESARYIEVGGGMGGGGANRRIDRVTGEALRAVGVWPNAETMTARIISELQAASDREPDPEQRSKLKTVATALGGTARDIFTDVVAAVIAKQTGAG